MEREILEREKHEKPRKARNAILKNEKAFRCFRALSRLSWSERHFLILLYQAICVIAGALAISGGKLVTDEAHTEQGFQVGFKLFLHITHAREKTRFEVKYSADI